MQSGKNRHVAGMAQWMDVNSEGIFGTPGKPALLAPAVGAIALLGSKEKVTWRRDAEGLHVTLPAAQPGAEAFALRIEPPKG